MSVRLETHVVRPATDAAMLDFMRDSLGFTSTESQAHATRFVSHYNGNLAGLRLLMNHGPCSTTF